MAHWWLPRHSAIDLPANSMSSKLWLNTPARYTLQVQPMKARIWTTNAKAAVFGLLGDISPPPDPCTLQSVAPCLSWNKIAKNDMIYLNQILMNPYREEELVSVSLSVWPEISYLANLISDNFQSVD